MKKVAAQLFAVLVVLFASVGTASAGAPQPSFPELFDSPTCNTNSAIDYIRSRLRPGQTIDSDGHFPWPGVDGLWVKPSKDLVIEVSLIEESIGSPRGAIAVRFYSLCTWQPMGFGFKALKAQDWNATKLIVPIEMTSGSCGRLKLELNRPNSIGDSLTVRIFSTDPVNPNKPLLDAFRLRKI